MEHLAVHLPYEALLRGSVHYGWMYQYEGAMKYLKGKAKNLAKVEGSIIAGRRYDDGGVAPTYAVAGVPDIFSQIGRLGGKLKVVDYEDDPDYPKWLHERATSNYGICVKGETDFYGLLTDIIEVEFPGILKLKCVLFKCEWFDPIVDRGVRFNKFGVVDVNGGRRYNKFEPFILASQADQVSFLPYPRMRESGINWLAVIKVTPRGRIIGGEEPPLQEEQINVVEQAQQQIDDILLIDPHNEEYEDVMDDATDEAVDDEFNENDDVSSDDENDDVSD
ncbi:hypothetical protein Bca4012_010468 [Brassica carinata]